MSVGSGVSEARTVGVSVGEGVQVTVADWVGEGSGSVVHVDSIEGTGSGAAISLSPPQPSSKRADPDSQMKYLPLIATLRLRSAQREM